MEINADKLEELFDARYKQLMSESTKDDGFWIDYCDKYKIFMLHADWMRETLNEGLKGKICIHNCEEMFHENVCPWLLVPRKFAEKALALGGLP
jgi:hypothetical protein